MIEITFWKSDWNTRSNILFYGWVREKISISRLKNVCWVIFLHIWDAKSDPEPCWSNIFKNLIDTLCVFYGGRPCGTKKSVNFRSKSCAGSFFYIQKIQKMTQNLDGNLFFKIWSKHFVYSMGVDLGVQKNRSNSVENHALGHFFASRFCKKWPRAMIEVIFEKSDWNTRSSIFFYG